METLQELTTIHKQQRDIDRFRSAFRGCNSEPCNALRYTYQAEILEDIEFEIENGRGYLMPLLKELTEEFEER